MLLLEYQWLQPGTTEYLVIRSFVPIQPPEHNPNHYTQVNDAIRAIAGSELCKATWIAGSHSGVVVFNGCMSRA